METRFQTSFIPKKTMVPMGGASAPVTARGGFSIYMTIAVLLFVASLGAIGGLYAWKAKLLTDRETYKKQLNAKEQQFKPAQIEELKKQNVKIDAGRDLINKHIAASGVFGFLSQLTIENVQFLSLDFSVPEKGGEGIKISLKGQGTSLPALAWQSDVLANLEQYGLRKIVNNAAISDPSLDTKGLVAFGFTATIDPKSLLYTKAFKNTAAASTTTGADAP